jgi:hypothetical protein
MRLAAVTKHLTSSSVAVLLRSTRPIQYSFEQKLRGTTFSSLKLSRPFHQSLFKLASNQNPAQSLHRVNFDMAASKQAVRTDRAPPPAPFLSQGVVVNGMVYCSGQIGQDPETGKVIEGTVQDRTV